MLPNTLRNQIIRALLDVPRIDSRNRRDELLINLPPNIIGGLTRDDAARTDLTLVIGQLDRLGRLLDTGERPLVIIAQAAMPYVEGTEAGRMLSRAISTLEDAYKGAIPEARGVHLPGDPPKVIETSVPEAIIFGDERVSYSFMERALSISGSIARLMVPRFIDNEWVSGPALGTSWVVAPALLITNHHVIAARYPGENDATVEECATQAAKAFAWFDYRLEGGAREELAVASLVCCDAELDYAVLRLAQATKRRPLMIAPKQPFLARGDRLNIVQHPRGGPLKYAIRSNHYVGTAGPGAEHLLRYLTDTEGGSSGSPVFDENWGVVALHHAATQVAQQEHQGKVTYVNNEGIAIHAIVKHLPAVVRAEIEAAQGWLDVAHA